MRSVVIIALALVGALVSVWLLFLGAIATYDAVAGGDDGMVGDMWEMMGDMGGMMGDMSDMGSMMDGMMGRGDDVETLGSASGRGEVLIEDFSFRPSNLTVTAGTVVAWTNRDGVAHTVTAREGSFESDLLEQGDTFQATFDTAGTFAYNCVPHPWMEGKVIVGGPGR